MPEVEIGTRVTHSLLTTSKVVVAVAAGSKISRELGTAKWNLTSSAVPGFLSAPGVVKSMNWLTNSMVEPVAGTPLTLSTLLYQT